MVQPNATIRELELTGEQSVYDALAERSAPLVFRGVAAHWPLVRECRDGAEAGSAYLLRYYNQAPVTAFISEADTGGRIFYNEDLSKTNFRQVRVPLDEVLKQIQAQTDASSSQTIYMGSMPLSYCLPGLREDNSLAGSNQRPTVRIWIGNRTRVAAHYDTMDNVACVCAGRRRFTLFPPEQLENLYVGPLDFTPAGQAVSLVDGQNPDLDRYPRFVEALANAQTAELEPGDAIFIPSMWWHQIEALDSFNVLINHWWRDAPAYLGAPGDALLHAILSIRDLSAAQREAWRGLFDHYVFSANASTSGHIPADQRGVLGELDEDQARKLRSLLRKNLNR